MDEWERKWMRDAVRMGVVLAGRGFRRREAGVSVWRVVLEREEFEDASLGLPEEGLESSATSGRCHN